ncbi:hypothetical protein A6J66_006945 [Yersinia enterocolitica]|nr:hypothetical protein A6J66_006945 [Yersinia enterocolitica]
MAYVNHYTMVVKIEITQFIKKIGEIEGFLILGEKLKSAIFNYFLIYPELLVLPVERRLPY